MSGHANPCKRMVRYEFIGELQCALGAGHLAECRVERSTIDVARLCRLSRYESALREIVPLIEGPRRMVSGAGQGAAGYERLSQACEIATEALDFD